MFRFFTGLQFYYDAPDAKAGGAALDDGDDSLERDLADLGDVDDADDKSDDDKEDEEDKADLEDDTDDKDDDKENEEEDDVDEDKDEDKEDKKDGKKDKEDKEEPEASPVSIKAIKTKYPNIFKEFPQLRSAFFLAPKFLEVFPDPESAQEAATKAGEYDTLEATLVKQGDPKLLVSTLAENNPKALRKIVANFGEAVRSVSQDDYVAMSTPIIEELLFYATKHGEKTGNKNLTLAARHLANYVFVNGGEIPDITKRASRAEPSDAEKELQAERESSNQREFSRALSEVGIAASKEIDFVLNNKLDGLSSFEKRAIAREAKTELDRTLNADKGFQKTIKALWAKAAESGYSDESKSRVKRTWLDRAKAIAPGIRNRLRQEALDAKNPDKSDSKGNKGQKRSFSGQGAKVGGRAQGFTDPKKIDWNKTSDKDILG